MSECRRSSQPDTHNIVIMKQIPDRLHATLDRIARATDACGRNADDVRLLAVSKTKPVEDILSAYNAGQNAFGENYLQEALHKIAQLADHPIEWHYIGRLQSNKTHDVSRCFAWVHGLENLKHARRLSEQRPSKLPPLQVCIQVNLSGEASKGGIAPEALLPLARAVAILPRLTLRGLMTMPNPNSSNEAQRAVFASLREHLARLRNADLDVDTLSMGMSGDLEDAIAEGATIVRIGTDIFGPRQPKPTADG